MYTVNQVVNVNSFYFPKGQALRAFPRHIEFGGIQCTFIDGLQYLVYQGKNIIKLFDMTDGRVTYRLRLENEKWTLVRTTKIVKPS
ncbi:MAG: hypothetical protein NVS1B7_6090 [Candidatus Saccharimonadales bacterium]